VCALALVRSFFHLTANILDFVSGEKTPETGRALTAIIIETVLAS
jgi:hypothetical protein